MNGLLRAPESKKSSWAFCIKGILLSPEVLSIGLHPLQYDNQYSKQDIGKPGRAPASSASLAAAFKTRRSYIPKQHPPGLRHPKAASPRPQTSQSSISQTLVLWEGARCFVPSIASPETFGSCCLYLGERGFLVAGLVSSFHILTSRFML